MRSPVLGTDILYWLGESPQSGDFGVISASGNASEVIILVRVTRFGQRVLIPSDECDCGKSIMLLSSAVRSENAVGSAFVP